MVPWEDGNNCPYQIEPGWLTLNPGMSWGAATGMIPDRVTYPSIQPDPDSVLPAGYVNPALGR